MKYEPDDAQLFAAAGDNRVLVTKNGDDFALLHRAWQRWSVAWGVHPTHAGILIIAADWLYPDAAQGIHDLIQSDDFAPNQLYEWRGHGMPDERRAPTAGSAALCSLDTRTARAHNR